MKTISIFPNSFEFFYANSGSMISVLKTSAKFGRDNVKELQKYEKISYFWITVTSDCAFLNNYKKYLPIPISIENSQLRVRIW